MKKRFRSLTTVLLAFIMATLMIGTTTVNAAYVECESVGLESTGNSTFDAFINDSRWTEGVSWWGDYTGGKGPEISPWGSSGCCAYAADFAKYCFNSNSPSYGEEFGDVNAVRAGDVIHIGYDYNGHWFVVLKRIGNDLYTAEGNYGGVVRIGWNYSISGDRFNSDSRHFDVGYHFQDGKTEVSTPTISFNKSSYTIGETAKISWTASPSDSDFKHYWLVIKNTTTGKQYYGTATGGDGDVSKNSYDLPLTEAGTYKVDVYAVNQAGGGKSDSKTFGVGLYELATPSISIDKDSYIIGETAKITWVASPSESDFKHYWLVIKNTTNGKTYYGTATGGDGDVSKNYYDLPLIEAGTYKVDVYAVDHGSGGKSDSKTFSVGKYYLTTPSISFDKSNYVIGETAKITWDASPLESNFKHYWLVIKNTTSGKQYYGSSTGGNGDVSKNYYDLFLTEAGTYKVDVYAVNNAGGGKSDSKTFSVEKYDLTTPNISFDKSSYMVGETAKITWTASTLGSDFKHYWLVITNKTSGTKYYGTATGGDGDFSKNYYDLSLTEAGTYKVDVYAVNHDGGGKSDSKTFDVEEYDLTIPSISFDKSRYMVGETARITWDASPSGPDFKHYWLVIKNTTSGKQYYGTATGGNGDVSKNYYDLSLTEAGTYKVDVYAVNSVGGGKSDSKTIDVEEYDLTIPSISFDKSRYMVGETARITWDASPSGPDFKHYWLVIKNTTSGKQYHGSVTGVDGDVSKNFFDLKLIEAGTYKVDVYAVNNDGGGKSDSKTFIVRNDSFDIGDTNRDGIISIGDATAIQRHLAELEVFNDEQLALADTNGDGRIDIADATHLQMYLAEYDVVLGSQA